MKNIFLLLSLCLIAIFPSQGHTKTFISDFDIATGYRKDAVNWNIGGLNGKPNILSELKWKDLQSSETAANFRISTQNNLYLRGSASYGTILSGISYDSDYDGDDRMDRYSKTEAKTRGRVYDLSVAFGPQFNFCNNTLNLVPLIGYSLDVLHLKMTQGFKTIGKNLGPFKGLDDTYRVSFQSPFIGVDLIYLPTTKITLFGTIEYHVLNYKGTGYWNLRKLSFLDSATGPGISSSFSAFYKTDHKLSFGLTTSHKAFRATKGLAKTSLPINYDKGVTILRKYRQPFNAVNWQSFSLSLAFKYSI